MSISVKGDLGSIVTCSDDEEYIVVGGFEEREEDDDIEKGLFMSGAVVLTGMDLDEGFGPALKEGNDFARKVPVYDKGWTFEFQKNTPKDGKEQAKKLEADNQALVEEKILKEMQSLEQQFYADTIDNQNSQDEMEIVRVNETALQSAPNGSQRRGSKRPRKNQIKFKNVIAPGLLPPLQNEGTELKNINKAQQDNVVEEL